MKSILYLISLFAIIACSTNAGSGSEKSKIDNEMYDIVKAVDKASQKWIDTPGVIAVSQGEHEGKPCILILSSLKKAEAQEVFPSSLEGHPVIVRYSDDVVPQ